MIPLIYVAAVGAALLLTDGRKIVQRKQQKQLVVVNNRETPIIQEDRKKYQWNLLLSGSALASLLIAPAFYPLKVFSITLLSRMMIDVAAQGLTSISQQRRPTLDSLDALVGIACIWSGQWVVLSISGTAIFARHAFIAKKEADSLQSLTKHFQPSIDTVRLQTIDNHNIHTSIEKIKPGDKIIIKVGETIPIDGVVFKGVCTVNERIKHSEYLIEKTINDKVLANSTVTKGEIVITATKSGNTMITNELSAILSTTKESTVALELKGEEIANFFAPANFTLGLITLPFIGAYRSAALWNAVPTAYFHMIVPVAVLQQITTLAELGIIVKDGRSLTRLSKVTTVIFDKIGTLTEERMIVTEIMSQTKLSKTELLSYAASLEAHQSHPIAQAIITYAKKHSTTTIVNFTDIELSIGQGICGNLDGDDYRIGNFRYLKQAGVMFKKQQMRQINYIQNQGASCVCLARNRELLGILTLMPKIRDSVFPLIKALQQAEIKMIIVSGDHQQATKATADILGIKKYVGECSPQQKAQLIETLQAQGEIVCFIGDGINDIDAMQQATISICVSGAMRVAQENADIIYMHNDFPPLMHLINQAKQHIHNLQEAMHATIVPSPVIIIGATFFGMGLLGSLVINQLGILMAMRALKHTDKK